MSEASIHPLGAVSPGIAEGSRKHSAALCAMIDHVVPRFPGSVGAPFDPNEPSPDADELRRKFKATVDLLPDNMLLAFFLIVADAAEWDRMSDGDKAYHRENAARRAPE